MVERAQTLLALKFVCSGNLITPKNKQLTAKERRQTFPVGIGTMAKWNLWPVESHSYFRDMCKSKRQFLNRRGKRSCPNPRRFPTQCDVRKLRTSSGNYPLSWTSDVSDDMCCNRREIIKIRRDIKLVTLGWKNIGTFNKSRPLLYNLDPFKMCFKIWCFKYFCFLETAWRKFKNIYYVSQQWKCSLSALRDTT